MSLFPLVAALRAPAMAGLENAASRSALRLPTSLVAAPQASRRTRVITGSLEPLGEAGDQAFAEDVPPSDTPPDELHDMLASPFAGISALRECLSASDSDADAEGCRLDYASLFSDEALGWAL